MSDRVKTVNESKGLDPCGCGWAVDRDLEHGSKLRFIVALQNFAMRQIAQWTVWGSQEFGQLG